MLSFQAKSYPAWNDLLAIWIQTPEILLYYLEQVPMQHEKLRNMFHLIAKLSS